MHACDPEHLLRDVAWLRRLARRLASEETTADDLAGDAVLAWAGAAVAPRSLRGWLATVVRHRAERLHRRSELRQQCERTVARDEALPAVDDAIARTELHRAVVDAVLALREPYRSAIVLRFLEDLPLATVAARLQVPAETARTRIKRGLEQLRVRLDRRYGGRAAWAGLIGTAPPAPPLPGPWSLGVLLMGTKSLLAVAAVAAAATLYLLLPRDPAADATPRAAAGGPDPAPSAARAELAAALPLRREVGDADPSSPKTSTAPTALVRGRAVDEASGRPLAGVRIAWLSVDGEALATEVSPTTEDGRFELAMQNGRPPDGSSLVLRAVGHALTAQALGNARDGSTPLLFEVGDVLMPPGTAVSGSVADHTGAPASDVPLFVCLASYWTSEGRLVRLAQAQPVGRTRADGTFQLEARLLPNEPPPLLFAAGRAGVGWVELDALRRDRSDAEATIRLLPPHRVRVRVTGDDGAAVASARVVAEPRFLPLAMPATWPVHVEAVPELAAAFAAATDRDGAAILEPLAVPGGQAAYTLRVEAPGYARTVVPVRLPHAGTLEVVLPRPRPLRVHGHVRDAGGRPIARARVVAQWPHRTETTSADDGTFALSTARGDGPLRVSVHAVGWFSSVRHVQPEAGRDDVVCDFALLPALELLGRILDQSGSPVRGASVWRSGGEPQSVTSGKDGTFRLLLPPAAPALLHVSPPQPSTLWAGAIDHLVEAGQASVTLVLQRLPESRGSLEVELIGADGRPLEARRVALVRRGDGDALWHPATALLGRIEAADLPQGAWSLDVDAATGCGLSADFTVAAGEDVRLRLVQQQAVNARGSVVLPAGASDTVVDLAFHGQQARFVAAPGQELLARGRGLRVRADGDLRFTVADIDPTRPLVVTAAGATLRGSAAADFGSGIDADVRLVLEACAVLQLTSGEPFAADRLVLQLRRPGGAWEEKVRVEGIAGRTQLFELPVAPGTWHWRVLLPTRGADNRAERGWHEGTCEVAAGGVAVIPVPRP